MFSNHIDIFGTAIYQVTENFGLLIVPYTAYWAISFYWLSWNTLDGNIVLPKIIRHYYPCLHIISLKKKDKNSLVYDKKMLVYLGYVTHNAATNLNN